MKDANRERGEKIERNREKCGKRKTLSCKGGVGYVCDLDRCSRSAISFFFIAGLVQIRKSLPFCLLQKAEFSRSEPILLHIETFWLATSFG